MLHEVANKTDTRISFLYSGTSRIFIKLKEKKTEIQIAITPVKMYSLFKTTGSLNTFQNVFSLIV